MKISLFAIMVLFICTITSYGQSKYSIKGTTVDTLSKTKLTTTVTVLNAKDSILQTYTHTGTDGSFTLPISKTGTYLLWVTYPGYASYEEKFTVSDAAPIHNFGNINLQDRAKLLNEVVIKGEVTAIKIKGDTTVYNAKAFVIQPNDKVEDLLKQLPDVQVDKDGKITAQGEKVPKVYVDGEEFFGDDPLLVTRNLRADMVDKVEIYNKKSDQAAFTGIDDGKTTKAINIKLREDKKTGVFGKAFVGVANDNYYDSQVMFNKFKGKYKLSVYGTTSNIGKNGLGYEDASKLGSTSTTMVDFGDGAVGISISTGDDYDNSSYSGRGIPHARTAGGHYDTKWGADKQSINANYRIGSLSLNTTQNTDAQLNFTGSPSHQVSSQNSNNHTFRQKADIAYQNNFDPNTNLKFTLDGTIRKTDNTNDAISTTENQNGVLLNKEIKSEKSNGEQKLLNAAFIFNKKFKKPMRTISWNVSEAYSETNSKKFFISDINPIRTPTDTTNQYKPTLTSSSVLNSNLTYTEPLTKKLAVTLNYGLGINNAVSDLESFNQSAPNKYNVIDTNYTNNYKFNQLTNQLGALFNYRGDKVTLTFGTKASDINYKQIDQIKGKVYKRSFINWVPQAVFRYKFGPSTNYSLSYSGSPFQPTIDQIQPIKVNTNPLNIVIGNPALEPSFRHNFSTSYSASKSISGQYISFGGSYSVTTNPIVTYVAFDNSTGKRVTQYLNLTDKNPYNYSIRTSLSRRILGTTAELDLSGNYSVNYSYTNDLSNNRILSTIDTRSYNASVYIQRNEAKKYSIYLSGGPSYSINHYSTLPTSNNNALNYNISTQEMVYLPGKFQIATDISYRYQGAVTNIEALTSTMWNASITKNFLKEDNLKFIISVNNLLNQEQFTRSVTPTGITQTSYNTLKRYFMFTISWDFTKFGTTAAKN